jgi:hypothetical protein
MTEPDLKLLKQLRRKARKLNKFGFIQWALKSLVCTDPSPFNPVDDGVMGRIRKVCGGFRKRKFGANLQNTSGDEPWVAQI